MDTVRDQSKAVCVLSHWKYPYLTNQLWGGDLHEATRIVEIWNADDIAEWGVKLTVAVPSALGTTPLNARTWGSTFYSGKFIEVNAVLNRDGRYAINPRLVDWNDTRVVDPTE